MGRPSNENVQQSAPSGFSYDPPERTIIIVPADPPDSPAASPDEGLIHYRVEIGIALIVALVGPITVFMVKRWIARRDRAGSTRT